MKFPEFFTYFKAFIKACPRETLESGSRYVFLSDLHMGDGGSKDDLAHNRELVETMLSSWYLEKGYTLVLNGDIEDLSKFDLSSIKRAWEVLYTIFNEFYKRGRLRKIVGNHDLTLLKEKEYPFKLLQGLVLTRDKHKIGVFHGHQASAFYVKFNNIADFMVRYLAKPLNFKNASISGDSRRTFKAERRIYRASKYLGMVSISGHTHRPLFESLSKYDSLRWAIERDLRSYTGADPVQRTKIEELILLYRKELKRLGRKKSKLGLSRSLYEVEDLIIPCVFNSGCATGNTGVSAIEIDGDQIRLVHWGEKTAVREYMEREAVGKDELGDDLHVRYVLKQDNLAQVFLRIDLLGRNLHDS